MEKEHIWRTFDTIAPTYDRINRILSLGIDLLWRKKMGTFLPEGEKLKLLDCASGTADQLLSLLKRHPQIGSAIASDLSKEMLAIGEKKVAKSPFREKVRFMEADACSLPFEEASFDCVTISFGIRNVPDVSKALTEFYRVLKPGGRLLILEFSQPKAKWLRGLFLFYLRHVLPKVGGLLSGNRKAYAYLNSSIEGFPYGKEFSSLLERANFSSATHLPLSCGIATIYTGDKS